MLNFMTVTGHARRKSNQSLDLYNFRLAPGINIIFKGMILIREMMVDCRQGCERKHQNGTHINFLPEKYTIPIIKKEINLRTKGTVGLVERCGQSEH